MSLTAAPEMTIRARPMNEARAKRVKPSGLTVSRLVEEFVAATPRPYLPLRHPSGAL